MPLIVIKRKEKGLARQCEDCNDFVELKDDPKQYPSTVAVVCNAPQTEWVKCFDYMWLMVKGRRKEVKRRIRPEPVPIKEEIPTDLQQILNNLRKIGKKRPLRL